METSSPKRAERAEPVSRPTLVDFLLLLAGVALSLYLVQVEAGLRRQASLSPQPVRAAPGGDARTDAALAFFAVALRLGEGVVLLWPLFFFGQRFLGRSQGLTAAEWLWVVAWLGVALLGAADGWRSIPALSPPEFLEKYAPRARLLWYLVFVPAMAALAGVLLVVGLFRSQPPPWTDRLGLALALWPVGPLVVIQSAGSLGP
jgi:hypothetical protein